MRITTLLAAVAVSSGAIGTATAQSESRVRVVVPPAAGGAYRIDAQPDHRAALGIGTSATGTLRDTLGLLITSITAGSPAERAGLEEGNRLAAINSVSLRTNAADAEDGEMSSALTRRLTRELAKSKPGDDVSLSVYRDGHMQSVKVKAADSEVLFARGGTVRVARADRAAIGIMLGNSGSRRDTLGVLVIGVTDSTPAARAGIEEGNRIAAINGVNLRVAREDVGDHWVGSTKADRLQRAIGALRPGDNLTLKLYANGQFRDVTMKAARAGDLPRNNASMFMGDGFSGMMRAMPPMPAMAPMPATPAVPRAPRVPMEGMRMELTPELRDDMEGMRVQLERIRPEIERSMRPQLERLRMELPRAMEQLRAMPRMRMTVVV